MTPSLIGGQRNAPFRAASRTTPGLTRPRPGSSNDPPNARHSTYRFRSATVGYRWHPLFGRTLQVSPFRRGKELTCIYTDERPDLCRELPNWMFDESYCSGMTLGEPEIGIDGLNELADVLALLNANRRQGAQSSPSRKREVDRAEKPSPRSSTARSRAGTPECS